MEFRRTKRGSPRGVRADAETHDRLLLIKRVSEMRATYQVRLLAYRALQEGKKLVIDLPNGCGVHPTLQELISQLPDTIQITRS